MDAADLFNHRARLTPDREAVLIVESGQRLTYAQLNQRANQAANWLRAQGLAPGDRISILAHNSLAYLELFYAVGKIGAILAPLNWRLAPAELHVIVSDCRPRLLIYGPEFAAAAAECAVGPDAPRLVSQAAYSAARAQMAPVSPVRPALDGESPYCLLYTSGTTGRPKGAIIPHRQIVWNCINTAISWGLTEQDVSPILTPLFHAGGLFAFLTPLLYVGGRIVLARTFDPAHSLHLIAQERCTVILGVPTLFQMWLNTPEIAHTDLTAVRFFISGGAPCPVPLMQAWRRQTGTILRQGYGLTEVGPNCFSMTDAESEPRSGTVGKPIFHTEMRLVDAAGRDVGVGETGELIIQGPHVCAGYWNNPEATAQAIRDGWFYTGDMARQDADGFFTIVGRFKDMIISGGENIYAAEVEAAFLEHSAVADCALIGQPDSRWGEVGVLIVVLRDRPSPSPAESAALTARLRAHAAGRLARYKIPHRFIFTDALPYSPYGKVQKAELRQVYGQVEATP